MSRVTVPACAANCGAPAADGLLLCRRHTEQIADDLAEIPAVFAALGVPAGASGEARVSGTPEPAAPLDADRVDARADIRAVLAAWCGLVADERGVRPPPVPDPAGMCRYLLVHRAWLAAHPAAGDCADELHAAAYGPARAAAYPSRERRPAAGPCPEGCGGTVVLTAGALVCTVAPGHRWPPQAWGALRAAMRAPA